MSTHANCSHPATRSARATCRRQRTREMNTEAKVQAKLKPVAVKGKTVVASNGNKCTPLELAALREIARADAPNCKSNETAIAIKEKGFAYWNDTHHIWMLTLVGGELIK